jgi:exosortase
MTTPISSPATTIAGPIAAARPAVGPWVQAGMVGALLLAIYHRTVATMWTTWTTNDNYSHGPLVPVVALGLAWMRRDRLRGVPARPDSLGLALIALACGLQVLGVRADVFTFQGWSLVIMVYGLVLTFRGRATTRILAFPIAYLVFMLTFPPFVVNDLSYALKELTVRLSTWAASALGVMFQRSGMTLYLASGELRVENPCSGLRSLIALVATGAVFAWIQPGGWWRKLIMLGSAVPIAMLGNAVRLTAILLVAHYAGVEKAVGKFHDGSGYLVYVVALASLFAVRSLLRVPAKERAT